MEGIDVGMDEEAVGVDVDAEWVLSGCADRSMSRKSCFGCIHWARSRIVAVACQSSPAWPGTLLLNLRFRSEMLQESPSHVDGQYYWEGLEGLIACAVSSLISKCEEALCRESLA